MNQEYDMFLPFIMSLRVTFVQKRWHTTNTHYIQTNKIIYATTSWLSSWWALDSVALFVWTCQVLLLYNNFILELTFNRTFASLYYA